MCSCCYDGYFQGVSGSGSMKSVFNLMSVTNRTLYPDVYNIYVKMDHTRTYQLFMKHFYMLTFRNMVTVLHFKITRVPS